MWARQGFCLSAAILVTFAVCSDGFTPSSRLLSTLHPGRCDTINNHHGFRYSPYSPGDSVWKPRLQPCTFSLELSSQSVPGKAKNKVVSMARDFHYGWLQVHNNYLHIQWKVWKSGAVFLFPVFLCSLPLIEYFPKASISVLLSFQKLLLAVATVSIFPIISTLLLLLLATGQYGVLKGVLADLTGPRTYLKDGLANDISSVFIAPFFEELSYRAGIYGLFLISSRMMAKLLNNEPNETEKDTKAELDGRDRKRQIMDLSPWMIASTVLFALAHVDNHLPVPQGSNLDDIVVKSFSELGIKTRFTGDSIKALIIIQFIFGALFHVVVGGVTSVMVFCPLYRDRGFMASFGAHASFNFFGSFYLTSLALRTLRRVLLIVPNWLRRRFFSPIRS